jgi:hypothetical protein
MGNASGLHLVFLSYARVATHIFLSCARVTTNIIPVAYMSQLIFRRLHLIFFAVTHILQLVFFSGYARAAIDIFSFAY